MAEQKNVVLGALWKKEDADYLTGSLDAELLAEAMKESEDGKIRIIIFANQFKKKETHPDFQILLSRPKEKKVAKEPERPSYAKKKKSIFD